MVSPLTRICCCCLLALTLGLHWAGLQTLGWVGMIASFTQTSSLKEAVLKTFGGDYPCQVCKFVKAGREQEKKQTASRNLLKRDLFLTPTPSIRFFPPEIPLASAAPCACTPAISDPPWQPPRLS